MGLCASSDYVPKVYFGNTRLPCGINNVLQNISVFESVDRAYGYVYNREYLVKITITGVWKRTFKFETESEAQSTMLQFEYMWAQARKTHHNMIVSRLGKSAYIERSDNTVQKPLTNK
jgi:hypothetical protein